MLVWAPPCSCYYLKFNYPNDFTHLYYFDMFLSSLALLKINFWPSHFPFDAQNLSFTHRKIEYSNTVRAKKTKKKGISSSEKSLSEKFSQLTEA